MAAASSSQFLEIEIREDTLTSLLAERRLKVEDLRCLTPRARRQLRRVLLQSLLADVRDGQTL
ncbi:hypothetical protein [Microbulbifer thermotolerans]|uniref:Uncharacterized protein n=1 Tax=Microbulbifer thermotolerans TaxID=252514 RepID=A0A143HIB4_MICTH|nr:hypothetical protein [Microbulbifer thermotolerans]AMX01231.1 hypothetical protein A3224_00335 [Microbulbifer thermotolerans]MCX2778446.1 hypothetical protein [Microbulbifer thermotolerans]MCX2783916.1 hypothetical protein [Microbulbifer thermotolerans]MCX2793929.1 hypothetical protein [Microbulbifer thermotolerans]MCX2802522.1 hypothetical protein [Microbulbifer thermotolerans]